MFDGFADLWKVRAGRRAAVAALGPFVSRSRTRLADTREAGSGIAAAPEAADSIAGAVGLDRLAGLGDVADTSDSVWLDPYLVGYLATLITLTAKRKTGNLKDEALAGVQETAFCALTGLDGGLFGTELVLLAHSPPAPFREGCRDGARFFALLTGEPPATADDTVPEWAAGFFHTPSPETPSGLDDLGASGPAYEAWDAFVDARLGA